jgi:uncharacterized protein YidB (DUF937 family)
MGLLDVISGMQHGPRSQPQPGAPASGGMSPITMAVLGVLAYKALKSFAGTASGAQPAQPGGTLRPPSASPGGSTSSQGGGGLTDILGGLFGGGAGGAKPGGGLADLIPAGLDGLLGGATAGSVLTRGLGNLVQDLQKSGQGVAAQSWIARGPNQEISPHKLADALGSDTIDTLSKQTGVNRDDLLAELSQHLPKLIDHLTPDGRLPTEQEALRLM